MFPHRIIALHSNKTPTIQGFVEKWNKIALPTQTRHTDSVTALLFALLDCLSVCHPAVTNLQAWLTSCKKRRSKTLWPIDSPALYSLCNFTYFSGNFVYGRISIIHLHNLILYKEYTRWQKWSGTWVGLTVILVLPLSGRLCLGRWGLAELAG